MNTINRRTSHLRLAVEDDSWRSGVEATPVASSPRLAFGACLSLWVAASAVGWAAVAVALHLI